MIVVTSDFTGNFAIANNAYSQLQAYIDKYEKPYLIDLLGKTLYDEFVQDFGLPSQSAKFSTIYDEFYIDDTDGVGDKQSPCFSGKIQESLGMKVMLLGFIYWEYVRKQKFNNTNVGTVMSQVENSDMLSFDQSNLNAMYNDALKTHRAIQWYIKKHISDYPDFNGKKKDILIQI